MHSVRFLHKWMTRTCSFMHTARAGALIRAVQALLVGGRLTLTDWGRSLPGAAHVKHQIKSINRLLGNRHLAAEREELCREIARWLLAASPRSLMLIDWADCNPGHRFLMLRAAVAVHGRVVPLYEKAYGC